MLKYFEVRPDLKIYWFAVTWVYFFRVHPAGRKIFFNHFKMEKIALILIYLTSFLSSSLRSTLCVYFLCNVDATIMNLAYLHPHIPQLAGSELHGTFLPRLSFLPPSPWMGWWYNHSLEGYIDGNFNEAVSRSFLLSLLIYFLFFVTCETCVSNRRAF